MYYFHFSRKVYTQRDSVRKTDSVIVFCGTAVKCFYMVLGDTAFIRYSSNPIDLPTSCDSTEEELPPLAKHTVSRGRRC